MSKGSSPRPYSVSQSQFASNWDTIFKKVAVAEAKTGTCGCGRSPTGNCIGWHSLTEEDYKVKLSNYELEQYKNQAQELWSDSCTTGRAE